MTSDTVVRIRSQISRAEIDGWLAMTRANTARLVSCSLHHFRPTSVQIGDKLACDRCGGTLGLSEIGAYIAGYEAHGGSADDVWPGYRATRVPT